MGAGRGGQGFGFSSSLLWFSFQSTYPLGFRDFGFQASCFMFWGFRSVQALGVRVRSIEIGAVGNGLLQAHGFRFGRCVSGSLYVLNMPQSVYVHVYV